MHAILQPTPTQNLLVTTHTTHSVCSGKLGNLEGVMDNGGKVNKGRRQGGDEETEATRNGKNNPIATTSLWEQKAEETRLGGLHASGATLTPASRLGVGKLREKPASHSLTLGNKTRPRYTTHYQDSKERARSLIRAFRELQF